MPKPLHRVSPRTFNLLKGYLCLKASIPINSKADCARLSSIIEGQTKKNISVSTLYRIFLHPRPTTPYIHTLNVLAQYCGFENWAEFEIKTDQSRKLDNMLSDIKSHQQRVDSLVKVCIHHNHLKPLLTYASQFKTPIDPVLGKRFGYEIYQALQDNPNGNDKFFRQAHHIPLIRSCFFEMMADQNFRLEDYEQGLKYYIGSAKPKKGEDMPEDYIFGNCLLFRRYYLQNRREEALQTGKRLYQNRPESLDKTKLFSLPVHARYLAYKFWYYMLLENSQKLKQYTLDIRKYWSEQLHHWHDAEKKIMVYFFGDVFSVSPTLNHMEVVLKSHFADFLESIPNFDFEKPLARYLPALDVHALTAMQNGDEPDTDVNEIKMQQALKSKL